MTTVIECHPPAAGKPAPDLKALKAKHDANRLLFLRIALVVIGLTFIFGIYTLGILWPSGWVWGQGYSHYLMMIIGVYATLGRVFAHRLKKSLRS
jgi:hypothetical protein